MSTGGLSCSTTAWGGVGSGTTYLNPYDTIDANGTITHWCFKAAGTTGNDAVILKIFRINGSNYDFVAESLSVVPNDPNPSLQQGTCNIAVLAGDLVGVTAINSGSPAGSPIMNDTEGEGAQKMKMISGDITTNTAQSAWSDYFYGKLIVHVDSTGMLDVYVDTSTGSDSNTGDSSSAPFLTFAKSYSMLASGGTIHCCASGYDFSAETVTLNKSFNMDINGSTGYFLMPQT
jgi:hypothetical protein